MISLTLTQHIHKESHKIILCNSVGELDKKLFLAHEYEYIINKISDNEEFIPVNQYSNWCIVQIIRTKEENYKTKEALRKAGCKLLKWLQDEKIESLGVIGKSIRNDLLLAYLEGIVLGSYNFIKYKRNSEKQLILPTEINVCSSAMRRVDILQFEAICKGVFIARDITNEPVSHMNAVQLSKRIKKLGNESGFSVEILEKRQIETLKMGGLLAVNKGSIDPPTFTIMEWKSENSVNSKPIVFAGKGVVYDTGGLDLKTSGLDYMKSDKGGASTVIGLLYAVALAKLPVHIIGLIPATDNRPGGNAFAPGDVIKMANGTTVENMNSDAEGRFILADALTYAQKYDPELVFDVATLTGSALRTVGHQALVVMGNTQREIIDKLTESGNNVYERIVELPLWDEYNELLKSDIADIKNIGGEYASAIVAGKFLEHFTDYQWIHIDIAPMGYLHKSDSYRGKGGTGYGVRLLFDFINQHINK